MGIKVLPFFSIVIILWFCKGSLGYLLQVSEKNMSSVFVELLRGRDGLPGRDGIPGRIGPDGIPGPQGKDGLPGPQSGGATYIRWGKSSCPEGRGTELVYSGIAGGSHIIEKGGGSNHLCMPKDPEYNSTLIYEVGIQPYGALIHGAEYQESVVIRSRNQNIPCSVCRVSTRSTVVMIPAKAQCYSDWTMEYYGYLMANSRVHYRTTFECVDKDMERLPGGHADINGALFYHAEASCTTGMPCPPYNNHQELNCVVCSK